MGILEEIPPFIFLYSVIFHMQTLPLAMMYSCEHLFWKCSNEHSWNEILKWNSEMKFVLMNKSENVVFKIKTLV